MIGTAFGFTGVAWLSVSAEGGMRAGFGSSGPAVFFLEEPQIG